MKRRDAKKDTRTKIILAVFAIVVLVSSIGGVVLFSTDGTQGNSNSFKLALSNGEYLFTRMQDGYGNLFYEVSSPKGAFTSYFLPYELKDMKLDEGAISTIKSSHYFYLTFDPNATSLRFIDYMRLDLRKNLPPDKYFQDAVISPSEVYLLPVATCENATFETPVFFFRGTNMTNSSAIISAGNCLALEFDEINPINQVKLRDSIVYLSRGIDLK